MSPAWERLSVREGGTVSALATVIAADGSMAIFAATPVGVFRSDDLGQYWRPLHGSGGSVVAVAGVEAVAASPRFAEDGTLFAGALGGLFRWRESAGTWEHLLSGSSVLGLVCVAGADDALTLLVGTDEDGILLSRDGGRTWIGANPGLLDLTVMALAAPPDFEQSGLAFAATTTGLYRTRNGAESWRGVDLDWDDSTIQCLALSPAFADDRLVLAGTEEFGLLRSEDAGRRWEDVPMLAERPVNSIAFGGNGRVVAATDEGLALSMDSGHSWQIVGEDLGAVASVCIVPHDAAILAGLPNGGVARSLDGGTTWESANSGLHTSLVTGVSISPAFASDQTLYITGARTGIDVSHDGGQTWTPNNEGIGEAGIFELASVPGVDGSYRLFAATGTGLYTRQGDDDAWHALIPEHKAVPAIAATAVAIGKSAAIFAALINGRILRSDDDGATWELLGFPFGSGHVLGLAISPSYATDRTVFGITTSERSSSRVGTLVVWRSTDGGDTWARWLEEPNVRGGGVARIVALPPNVWGDSVVVSEGGRLLRPHRTAQHVQGGVRRPLWQTTELPGQPSGGLPAITGLAASPEYARDRTLFVATSNGVYVSRDGGEHCTPWSEGLERPATLAVAPSPAYADDRLVYALGLGGTIWHRRDQ